MKLLWKQISSPEITTIYCNSNFDGVVFDDEHGNFNTENLFTLIQLVNAYNKKSFVRFADLNKGKVRRALDAGVAGLIFSTVDNVDYVNNIFNWCLYPPMGKRGQGLVAENNWDSNSNLLQKRNPLLIAQIENQEGLSILPWLNKNFDYYMLGPYDLTADLGCVADWENETYNEMINIFNECVPKNKRAVHLVSNIKKEMEKFNDYGLVALGMDTTIIKNTIKKLC